MCGNRRQRRGDIHVARVGALLRCAVFSFVRVGTAGSVGATFMPPACVRHCVVWAPSCPVGVCLTAPVPGVINGAPTGYAAVQSWCSAVFSSVRVGIAGSVGATFMSPACVRHCVVCAPLWHDGVCLSAPVPGVINGAPTLRLFDGYDGAVCFSLALKGNVSRVGRPICRPFVRQGETFVRSVRRSGGARRRVSGRTCAGCSRGRASGSSL